MALFCTAEVIASLQKAERESPRDSSGGMKRRSFTIGVLIGLMVLSALMGSALGLVMGTAAPPAQISLMFGLILTPLLFTGCTFNPWAALASLKWFQVVTLFNPLTYASEGLRSAMLPAMGSHPFPTLAIGWSLLGLSVAAVASFITGIKLFHRRVVS